VRLRSSSAESRTSRRQASPPPIELRLREASEIISRTAPHPCNNAHNPAEVLYKTARMKLNVKNIRYLGPDDWRVLTAVGRPSPTMTVRGLTADGENGRPRWAVETMR
jgi:sarcosine oxidase gamma subunit